MRGQKKEGNDMTAQVTDERGRLQSAEDAELLCASLMEITAELITVLERETSLLRKRQINDLQAIHLKKQALTTSLTRNLEMLRANADYIKMAVPGHVEDLQGQQRQFQKSLTANHEALHAMKAVSEQLIGVVSRKVNEKAGGAQTYGKEAQVATARPNQPTAISYDTVL